MTAEGGVASHLAELRGSVTVEIVGFDGAAVGTFVVPIAVMSQAATADHLSVAVGTPEGALSAAIRAAFDDALQRALDNIPTAEVTPWRVIGDHDGREAFVPLTPTRTAASRASSPTPSTASTRRG
ncbi:MULTISPECIES: hypothetical protein [unclassified Microbacterium]|uniref:hypothetical protein n=1 Tax=unclassified Microbacterium TaxID=2609290 RepID=UPI003657B811